MYYDSGYASHGVNKAIVSYNHIKQSVQGDVLWQIWIKCIFNCIIYLMVRIFGYILKPEGYFDS